MKSQEFSLTGNKIIDQEYSTTDEKGRRTRGGDSDPAPSTAMISPRRRRKKNPERPGPARAHEPYDRAHENIVARPRGPQSRRQGA